MQEEKIEISTKDILKHYISSIVVYGFILLFVIFCPLLRNGVENNQFNYIMFFIIYYVAYVVFALPIYLYTKPQTLLKSHNIAILEYVKRQFQRFENIGDRLKALDPKENEKQGIMIVFMKAFFGISCITILCNQYLPNIDYTISFLKEMFSQAITYTQSNGILLGTIQYIEDTFDMWLKIIVMLTTIILTVSYLTDCNLLKNKIKSIDTTPLGVISCIMCYYPLTILANQFIYSYTEETMPLPNTTTKIISIILLVIANLVILLATARLGTKSGNLTNRGIVTGFPYNIVRHPQYSMQMVCLIITTIPLFLMNDFMLIEKILYAFGTIGWIFVYYLRAVTEERHLIKDEEYQKYVENVKFRFIPKIF